MTQIQFIGTTPNDFIKQIKDEVIPQLRDELSKEFQPKKPTEYLTREDVCELLQIGLSTLWRWKRDKTIPFYGIGNRVYLKRSDIDELINKNKIN